MDMPVTAEAVVRGLVEAGEIPAEYCEVAASMLDQELRRALRRHLRALARRAARAVLVGRNPNTLPILA
mgnify:FL=1